MPECDFPALILKGLIEHNDRAAYLGSKGAVVYYTRVAVERVWVLSRIGPNRMPLFTPTLAGLRHYETSGLKGFSNSPTIRPTSWEWGKYKG